MAEIEVQLVEVLSILSESVRFKILSLIASKGELTAKDILSEFDFTQPTLSHHMSCLKDAGLVNVERRGRFAYYSVNKDTIDLLLSGIESLISSAVFAIPKSLNFILPSKDKRTFPGEISLYTIP